MLRSTEMNLKPRIILINIILWVWILWKIPLLWKIIPMVVNILARVSWLTLIWTRTKIEGSMSVLLIVATYPFGSYWWEGRVGWRSVQEVWRWIFCWSNKARRWISSWVACFWTLLQPRERVNDLYQIIVENVDAMNRKKLTWRRHIMKWFLTSHTLNLMLLNIWKSFFAVPQLPRYK